jgi:SAM-dependent methyltransferase
VTADPYDALAADYHWIFPDEHLSGKRFTEQYGGILARLAPASDVLDCACGIGVEALALARAGHRVTASDGSAGMVTQARAAVAASGLAVDVSRCAWEELPSRFGPRFDGVFCLGNSIAHSPDGKAMARSLAGMATLLRPGGLLVVESRDWEGLRLARERIELRGPSSVREAARGFCLYVWTIPERWEEPHVAEIVVVVEHEGEVRHRRVELRFAPYRREELVRWLGEAGLGTIEVTETRVGRYVVTGRR